MCFFIIILHNVQDKVKELKALLSLQSINHEDAILDLETAKKQSEKMNKAKSDLFDTAPNITGRGSANSYKDAGMPVFNINLFMWCFIKKLF